MTFPPLPFSAVLLAGGKSTRMGFDKAGLIIDGQPLWQRQLATLRALEPQELFISGRPDGPYIGSDVPVIFDAEPSIGPIGGLAAALRHAQHPYLLLLAVDLPAMTPVFLQRLVDSSAAGGKGAVPCFGQYEPLAAIYSRECLAVVEESVRGSELSLQLVIRKCVARGFVMEWALDEEDRPLFRNINHPSDVAF